MCQALRLFLLQTFELETDEHLILCLYLVEKYLGPGISKFYIAQLKRKQSDRSIERVDILAEEFFERSIRFRRSFI